MASINVPGMHRWGHQYHLVLPGAHGPSLSHGGGRKAPFLCSCAAALMVAHTRQQGDRAAICQQWASPRGFFPAYGPTMWGSSQALAGLGHGRPSGSSILQSMTLGIQHAPWTYHCHSSRAGYTFS